jgi:hypothetical protein
MEQAESLNSDLCCQSMIVITSLFFHVQNIDKIPSIQCPVLVIHVSASAFVIKIHLVFVDRLSKHMSIPPANHF